MVRLYPGLFAFIVFLFDRALQIWYVFCCVCKLFEKRSIAFVLACYFLSLPVVFLFNHFFSLQIVMGLFWQRAKVFDRNGLLVACKAMLLSCFGCLFLWYIQFACGDPSAGLGSGFCSSYFSCWGSSSPSTPLLGCNWLQVDASGSLTFLNIHI